MINYKEKTEVNSYMDSITCDSCKKTYSDEMELQEFHHINFIGGYNSIFGDSVEVKYDICQYCLKNIIKQFIN